MQSLSSSFGIVLLEIGLWQTVESLGGLHDQPDGFRSCLIRIAEKELPGQAGKIYANVVHKCSVASRHYSNQQTQNTLCGQVAAALDECKA